MHKLQQFLSSVFLIVLPLSYLRPDATVREENFLLLQATFLTMFDEGDPDDNLEGPCLSRRRRLEAADFLLDIDNGPWKSDRMCHTCQLGCCTSVKEAKLKFWVAVQARYATG